MKRIAAEYIYHMDSCSPLHNAFVELDDDGTVLRTGLCDDISAEKHFYKGAVVPGFTNSHCHIELSHLKGVFRKGSGMAGFIDQINELRECAGKQERIESVKYWMDRLWTQGVSAMADISNCDESLSCKASSPMYSRTFLEVFGTEPADCESVMESVRRLAGVAAGYGIDAAPTPHSCYTMSPELLTASAAEGLSAGFLSYHSQESIQEEQMMLYGEGPLYENRKAAGMSTPPVTGRPSLMYFLDRLEKVHEPPFDEHILLVHNVCLTEEAAEYAVERMNNVYWAICPMSNIFIHDMLPPLPLMRRKGLKLTLGTDSLSSNDDLDMVKEMYCIQRQWPDVTLGEILSWVCVNGAEFLGLGRLAGKFLPGMKPGVVLIENLDADGRLTEDSHSVRLV